MSQNTTTIGKNGLQKQPREIEKHGPHNHHAHIPAGARRETAGRSGIDHEAQCSIREVCGVETSETRTAWRESAAKSEEQDEAADHDSEADAEDGEPRPAFRSGEMQQEWRLHQGRADHG